MNVLIPITFTTYQAYFSLTTKKFPIGNFLPTVNTYAVLARRDKSPVKPDAVG